MSKNRWFLLLLILVIPSALYAKAPDSLPSYIPPKITIQGFLDPDTSTLAGYKKIEFINSSSNTLTEVSFLLPANSGSEPNPYISELYRSKGYYKNFDSSYTYVSGVKVNGVPVKTSLESITPVTQTYSLYSAKMIVELGELLPGESVVIEMDFLTKIPFKRGDFGLSSNGIFYLNGGFYPELLDFEEPFTRLAALFEADILLPSTLVVASNADYQSEVSTGGIYKKVSLRYQTPVFDLALVAGPGLFVKESTLGDIELYTYYLKGHEQDAVFAMQTASDVLQYYTKHFGPYTKKRFAIVEGSSLYEATSNQGMVFLPTNFYRYYNTGSSSYNGILSAVIAREVANSWFANVDSVSNLLGSTQSAWLNIALRTYAANSYFTHKRLGEDLTFMDRLGSSLLQESYSLDYNKDLEMEYLEKILFRGVDEPLTTEFFNLIYPETWEKSLKTKGYLVLRTLESFGGKDKVFSLLRSVSEAGTSGSYKIIDNKEFQLLANDVFKDLDFQRFWQTFVVEDAKEDLEILGVYQKKIGKDYEITLNLKSKGSIFWPVEVLLEYKDKTFDTFFVDPNSDSAIFNSSKPLKRATIDPKGLVFDIERLNNSYPRKTSFAIISGNVPESTGYSLDPILEIKPEENSLNAGFSLAYRNRFYNQLGYSLYYATSKGKFVSEIEYRKNFRNGQLAFSVLFPDQELTELGLDFEIKQMASKNTGYVASHNIDWFRGQVGLTYYPKLNDYNLKLTSTLDDTFLSGRTLSTTFDVSKYGGKLSLEAESIKAGLLAGYLRSRFNVQSSFYKPLEKASTTMHDVPEKEGDYALTYVLSASVPLILDKELVALGPFVWEDAEGRLSFVAGNAWERGHWSLGETQVFLKGELLLGFNFLTQPFALRISMAKDLRGIGNYSSISLSSRFYRQILGK